MGAAKREKERHDDLVQLGLALCEDVGVLEQCEHHPGTYFEGSTSLQDGYKIANARWTRGQIQGFKTRLEMTDAMKEASEFFVSEECVSCEKWKED
jgi:hypothetical protein